MYVGHNRLTSRRRTSIQLSKELAAELLAASIKVNEVVETLEVQLDKETLRRLKIGEKDYRLGRPLILNHCKARRKGLLLSA